MADFKNIFLQSKIQPAGTQPVHKPGAGAKSKPSVDFDKVLEKSSELQISKHAEKRLASRDVQMGDIEKAQLKEAVGALEKKGAKDSLVLMGESAFIVNVPTKTVVTALPKDQMKEQIFTNIDSTMLVSPKDGD